MWDKTVDWIRATDWAQTQEIPANIKRGSREAETKAKKQKSSWSPDALWSRIEDAKPGMNEITVDAHHTVEMRLIPLFETGMPVDTVQEFFFGHWTDTVKDLGTIA